MTTSTLVKGFTGSSTDIQNAIDSAATASQEWMNSVFEENSDGKVTVAAVTQSNSQTKDRHEDIYHNCFVLVTLTVETDDDELLAC